MKLGEEPLVLALHERMDPVPNEEEIDIHMLNGISFCAQIRAANWDFKNWDYNALLRDECRKNGFDISSIYECNGALAALMLTCAGIAACYIRGAFFIFCAASTSISSRSAGSPRLQSRSYCGTTPTTLHAACAPFWILCKTLAARRKTWS